MVFIQGSGKKYNTATTTRIIFTATYFTIGEWILVGGPGDGAGAEGVVEVEGVVVAEELGDVRLASAPVRIRAPHGRRSSLRVVRDGDGGGARRLGEGFGEDPGQGSVGGGAA